MTSRLRGVEYTFHGVGQGLFASGSLGDYRGRWMGDEIGEAKFQWVYDCGTASGDAIIDAAVSRFVEKHAESRRLGLLALSHFDRDHISGVVRLLEQVEVDVLLLPYVSLGERLLLALAEGIGADDPLMLFFINPVEYLRQADIRGILRVVFVEGSSSRGRSNGDDVPPPDRPEPRGWPDGEFRLEFDGRSISDVEPDLLGPFGKVGEIFVLPPGSALRIASYWEFVPYNDLGRDGSPGTPFRHDVGAIAERLRQAADVFAREDALRKLKARYDQEFGSEAVPRNRISLFLYCGPAGAHHFDGARMHCWATRAIDDGPHYLRLLEVEPREEGCSSILYTGDGYLNSEERVEALKQCLGNERFKAIAVCQVMHHGARGNWRPGVAAVIDPYFSVFSSDPNAVSPGHPHAEVLRDFWCHGPVQVDKRASAQFSFWWE